MLVTHIGLPKSGSATIQTFFSGNEVALRALSIDYVPVGRVLQSKPDKDPRQAHHNFANELKDRQRLFNPSRGSVLDLASYAGGKRYGTMVVSSEMFENCSVEQVQRYRDSLSIAAQQCLIVMIVRDFVNTVPSSYAQKIRCGINVYDFDEFFERRIAEERANYFRTAEKWAHNFGWENVRVRLLDSAHLINGDLIDDFLTTIGVDAGDPRIRSLPRRERVNEASGWKTLEATRALFSGRHGLDDHHPLSVYVTDRTPGGDGAGPRRAAGKRFEKFAVEVADLWGWKDKGRYLTRPQAQRCLDIYNESLRQLNERLAGKLPPALDLDARGFVEREFLPDASHIPPDELRAFYDAVWSLMAPQEEAGAAKRELQIARKQDKILARHIRKSQRASAGPGTQTAGDDRGGVPAGEYEVASDHKLAKKNERAARKAARKAAKATDRAPL